MRSTSFGVNGPVDWLKMGSFGAVAVAAWALSLVPSISKPIQGLFAGSAVVAAAVLVADTRRADRAITWGEIHHRVEEQIDQNEIAYAAAALDQQLQALYFGARSNPEVTEELPKSPEAEQGESFSDSTSQLTTYDHRFVAAIRALVMGGKSKSWITENVLGLRGSKFDLSVIERILKEEG
jgi:hypothetical protein